MTSLKKIYEMIELHDEKLKYNIDDKFNPTGYPYKNYNRNSFSFIALAIYCNNFEAYKLFINHKNFNKQIDDIYNGHLTWLNLIIQKYESCDTIENKRYLEELIKLDIIIEPSLFSYYCNKIDSIKFVFNKFDLTKNSISKIFSGISDKSKIKLFFLKYYFINKRQFLTKNVIVFLIGPIV